MNYNNLTLQHFATAARAGVLLGPEVRRGAAGSRAQGTWVQFDLQWAAGGVVPTVSAARFLAFGCPHVIAVSDWVAQQAIGNRAAATLPESVHALRERFGVPIEKLGRLLIVEDAWIAAQLAPYSP